MFLVNGLKAKLIQYNRFNDTSVYDDTKDNEISIKLCPYDIKKGINFGIYTTPEATGYFQIKKSIDARKGDQIVFNNQTYTILEVQDCYLFNSIENKVISVK